MKNKSIIFLLLCCSSFLIAQAQTTSGFPTDYFRNPLDIPITLAGGFGECRPNHFHTGIDLKTDGRENLPVHAAADGYISRISISSTGYGNCLYVTHPNGYTTVYGHLNSFYAPLQKWVEEQQYEQKEWKIQLFPKPGEFSVKKGQEIALSGATGGVTGPHLHFEIRNTSTEHVLNELLFGLPYKDNVPPHAQRIAIYNGEESIYMQSPETFALYQLRKGVYESRQKLLLTSNREILIGIEAKDYMNGSSNWMGIYNMKLFLDGHLEAETLFKELDFGLSRYANAYADFKTQKDDGVLYQGLYRLPNDKLHVYPFMNEQNGKLNLSDGRPHQVLIELFDPAGNKSLVRFTVKYDGKENAQDSCPAERFWNCQSSHDFKDSVFSFQAKEDAFYDNICFTYKEMPRPEGLSAQVQLMNSDIPIQRECDFSLKLNRKLPFGLQSKVAFVHHVKPTRLPGNNPQTGMAATYEDGWATASVRTFGNYYCVIDTIPPHVVSLQADGKTFTDGQQLRFEVTDDLTSVASLNGYVGSNWLLFVRKDDTYTYTIDDHCPVGKNTLELKAVDENNNEVTFSYPFIKQ